MTFPKVVVIILKHATSLRLSMHPGPALIQADLDYQNSDVDQKIQQYIGASQGPSAELDKPFIMGIEIGLSIFLMVQSTAFISNFRFNICAHIKRDCLAILELLFSHVRRECWSSQFV